MGKKLTLKYKIAEKISYKRGWRKKRSKLKRGLRYGRKISRTQMQKYNLRNYDPLNSFKKYKEKKFSNRYRSKLVTLDVPKIFCFIKKANETIKFLRKIKDCIFKEEINNVFISHEKCDHIGLTASYKKIG